MLALITNVGDDTMLHWYEDEKKVVEFAEFLVQSVEIVDVDELLEYFKHPDRYTDAWNIYKKDILSALPIPLDLSKKGQSHGPKQHIKTDSCTCGIT